MQQKWFVVLRSRSLNIKILLHRNQAKSYNDRNFVTLFANRNCISLNNWLGNFFFRKLSKAWFSSSDNPVIQDLNYKSKTFCFVLCISLVAIQDLIQRSKTYITYVLIRFLFRINHYTENLLFLMKTCVLSVDFLYTT